MRRLVLLLLLLGVGAGLADDDDVIDEGTAAELPDK